MKTKFAIGCLVQWYECDIIEEYVDSLKDAIDIYDGEVTIDFIISINQDLEKCVDDLRLEECRKKILSKFYTMYSIENQSEWMDKFPDSTTYINCRMKEYNNSDFQPPNIIGPQTSWYDPKDLFNKLPKNYDLILIDGPGGHWGRGGFLKFLDKFKTNIPILFDDINREAEFDLMVKTSIILEKEYKILDNDKSLGYIL